MYKVNTDGGRNELQKCSGIGVVIRDSRGQLIAASSTMIPVIHEADIVEAMALRRGIILAAEIGLRRIIKESDVEKVIRALRLGYEDLSDFGLIINDCKACVPNFLSFECSHVRRDSNRSAHAFAKHGTLIDMEEVWLEDSPVWAMSSMMMY